MNLSQSKNHISLDHAVHLIHLNKISSKNAFDFDFDTRGLSNLANGEIGWLKASAGLDASAKIYGYRVDQVHQETYKVLGGLARQNQNQNEEKEKNEKELFKMLNSMAEEQGVREEEKVYCRKKKGGISVANLGYNVIFNGGERTLEKDARNIDMVMNDQLNEIDPLFRSHRQRFDESGAKNLLLNILQIDKGLNLQFDSEMARVNQRVLFCQSKQEELKRQQKARSWAQCYIYPCGKEVAKISLYTQNPMSTHLEKIRVEMRKFIDNITEKDSQRDTHEINKQRDINDLDQYISVVVGINNMTSAGRASITRKTIRTGNPNAFLTNNFDDGSVVSQQNPNEQAKSMSLNVINNDHSHSQKSVKPGETEFQNKTTKDDQMLGDTDRELFGDAAEYQRMTATAHKHTDEIQEIEQPGSVSLNLNIAHGINERIDMEFRGSTKRGCFPTTARQSNIYDMNFNEMQMEIHESEINDATQAIARAESKRQSRVQNEAYQGIIEIDDEEMQIEQIERSHHSNRQSFQGMLPIVANLGAAHSRNSEMRESQMNSQRNQQKFQEMQEAKQRLLNENRLQMNEMFGSGQNDIFGNLREELSKVDTKGLSIGGMLQGGKKQQSQCVINDTVYRSFDAIEKEQQKKDAKMSQKIQEKIAARAESEINRLSSGEVRAKKRENSITSGIEKFLKSFKTKEIKPLHLDRHSDQQLTELGNLGKQFELATYQNFALRRFTNLFCRDTKVKLQEVEEQNIDFHGIQMLNASLNKGIEETSATNEASNANGQEKMLEQYFGIGPGTEESQLGFQAEERSCININQITNVDGPDGNPDAGSQMGSIIQMNGMSQAQENTLRHIKESQHSVLIDLGKADDQESILGNHRKNQNLNLLIKDIVKEQADNVMDELDETLSVFQDGIPRKKKLNTLLGKNGEEDENESDNEERTSDAENFGKIDIRVNAHKKFDIKQLKIEIWRIISLRGIPKLNYLTKSRLDENKDFTFTDLMVTFHKHISNQEMIECLSIHQTFVCLLHLANENCLKFERKISKEKRLALAQIEEDDGEFAFRDSKLDDMTSHALNVIMKSTVPKGKKGRKAKKQMEVETADQNDDFSDFNMFIEIAGESVTIPEEHELLLDEEIEHEDSVVSRVTTDFGAPERIQSSAPIPTQMISDTVGLINQKIQQNIMKRKRNAGLVV